MPTIAFHSHKGKGNRTFQTQGRLYLVHRNQDVTWTETQLSAIIRSTCKNTAIVGEEHGVELPAQNINDV